MLLVPLAIVNDACNFVKEKIIQIFFVYLRVCVHILSENGFCLVHTHARTHKKNQKKK